MLASDLTGAENETWRCCIEDNVHIFMNMMIKDNPKPKAYLYTEVTVQESGH